MKTKCPLLIYNKAIVHVGFNAIPCIYAEVILHIINRAM